MTANDFAMLGLFFCVFGFGVIAGMAHRDEQAARRKGTGMNRDEQDTLNVPIQEALEQFKADFPDVVAEAKAAGRSFELGLEVAFQAGWLAQWQHVRQTLKR